MLDQPRAAEAPIDQREALLLGLWCAGMTFVLCRHDLHAGVDCHVTTGSNGAGYNLGAWLNLQHVDKVIPNCRITGARSGAVRRQQRRIRRVQPCHLIGMCGCDRGVPAVIEPGNVVSRCLNTRVCPSLNRCSGARTTAADDSRHQAAADEQACRLRSLNHRARSRLARHGPE